MPARLKRNFFTQPTLKVAEELLGKCLVRKIGNKILVGKIVETEAYIGPRDKASHAFNGRRTLRNEAEYLIGGHVYIYLVYGMYWQLNISTSGAGAPECVLIRALEPITEFKNQNAKVKMKIENSKSLRVSNGPGKLCRWMRLNKSFNAEDITKSKKLCVADYGFKVATKDVAAGPRIGIDYAGPIWSKKPWRFYIKDNSWVSRRRSGK